MRKQVIVIVGCAMLLFSCTHLTVAAERGRIDASDDQSSVVAALTWLLTVDAGQYEQSWDTASTYFRSMVTKERWVSQVAAVRSPLGNLISREIKMKQYQTTMPGAPDGEYYVVSFNTVFEKKSFAVETVTVVKDKDDQWHLAGYFIR